MPERRGRVALQYPASYLEDVFEAGDYIGVVFLGEGGEVDVIGDIVDLEVLASLEQTLFEGELLLEE